MNFATTLLVVALVLLSGLLVYGVTYVLLALGVLPSRRSRRVAPRRGDRGAVTVLIPSHQEGEGLVDAIETVLHQDYAGDVSIWVLVEDEADSSVPFLARRFRAPLGKRSRAARKRAAEPAAASRVLLRQEHREVVLVAVGASGKRDKLNHALGQVSAPFVAVLDADHRAAPDWLSSAFATMDETGADAVQSRRRPLALRGLAQLWDSAENHVGNEVLNAVCARAGFTVFFTGTTALFRAALLRERRFADSLTEDTHLSHDLILAGETIAYDRHSGSYEEVAPSLASYVARRRRWSAGHTRSFFGHRRQLGRARLSLGRKLHLVGHGLFFLIPVAVATLQAVLGLYVVVQFARPPLLAVVLVAAVAATALRLTAAGRGWLLVNDFVVALGWTLPAAVALMVTLYRLSGAEAYYYLLVFPHARTLAPFLIAAWLAPLTVILAGALRLRGLKPLQVLLLVVTYPLQVFLAIYAGLLGASDLLLRRRTWTPIRRDNVVAVDVVPAAVRRRLAGATVVRGSRARWLLVPAALLALLLANDLLAVNECGKWRAPLWAPVLVKWGHPVQLQVELEKRITAPGRLELAVVARVTAERPTRLAIRYSLDGRELAARQLTVEHALQDQAVAPLPVGWERHAVGIKLSGEGFECRRERHVATSVVELKGRALHVNGEPFVVKGIIPSFSSPQVGLSMPAGFAQLKDVGANAVRFYHTPTAAALAAARQHQLLIVDQPDRSTWKDLDVTSDAERRRYLRRYDELLRETDGFPYLLLDNLGNELELGKRSAETLTDVTKLMGEVRAHGRRYPLSYSTYLTYVDYPVDLLGVNMLDTGATYWEGALALLARRARPFYASELGGFVAFSERVPSELRIARLRRYWDQLLARGGVGACFFQSHDNWAQSVQPGHYNDPLQPEQPDDVRGFWDHENRPKLELGFLAELLSDLEAQVVDQVLPPDAGAVRVRLRNRRPYRLVGMALRVAGGAPQVLGDLAPADTREVTLSLPRTGREPRSGRWPCRFEYTTHAGLRGVSAVELAVPVRGPEPVILNRDFVPTARDGATLTGRLLWADALEAVVPPGWELRVDGRPVTVGAGRVRVPVASPLRSGLATEWSRDRVAWTSLPRDVTDGGVHWLRFRLPRSLGRQRLLLLAGLGTNELQLTLPGQPPQSLKAHSYRENVVDLAPYGDAVLDREVVVRVDRQQVLYVHARFTPDRRDLRVALERPSIYAPVEVSFTRRDGC